MVGTAPRGAPIYPELERLSREDLVALQLRRLNRQLDRLWASNAFYRRHWRAAGIEPGPLRSLDDLRRFPLVSKEDILADQAATPPYGERLGIDPRDVFEITLSSGTSGKSQEVHAHSVRDAHMRGALHGLAFGWAGARPDDRVAFHIGISNSASHGSMHRGLRAVASLPYLLGHLGFDKRIELMRRFGLDIMYALPSALNGLAQACERHGASPAEMFGDLRAIVVSGEGWPVEFLTRMEETWGARVFEGYGASQTYSGFIMSNCEAGAVVDGHRGGMHMYEWAAILEVLDPDTLEPTPAGEAGELVVTLLEKEASPLVRFRTRDKVVRLSWSECSCGRQLDMIESGTVGRWDDMVKIKGENVFPPEVDAIVFARPAIGEYQADVFIGERGRDEAAIRVGLAQEHLGTPAAADLLDQLRHELKQRTNITFELQAVPLSDLPQYTTPDAKPRRWTDRRQDHLRESTTGAA